MSTLEEALDQIITRQSKYRFNSTVVKSEFRRLCALHFAAEVLPELRRFEDELKPQGVRINLVWVTDPALASTLVIEHPQDTHNLLNIKYDFPMRSLVFESSIGMNDCDTLAKFSLGQFSEVTRVKVYAFLQSFVRDVLAADTLCEFHDDEDEPLGI